MPPPRSSAPVRSRPSSPFRATPPTLSTYSPPPSSVAPTLGQSIKDGFGVGVGVSLAQRAVSAVLGPPTVQQAQAVVPVPAIAGYNPPCADYVERKRTMDACMKEQPTLDDCSKQIQAFRACIDPPK